MTKPVCGRSLNTMKQANIIFGYETSTGCEWLKETLYLSFSTITPRVEMLIREFAIDYIQRNKDTATALVDGWQRDGEEVEMYSFATCANGKIRDLACKILDQID